MGEGERSRAETKAHDISSRQKEDRGGTAGKVGEVEGCEEEIGGSTLGGEVVLNGVGSEGWEVCGLWESSKEEKVWIIFKRVSK